MEANGCLKDCVEITYLNTLLRFKVNYWPCKQFSLQGPLSSCCGDFQSNWIQNKGAWICATKHLWLLTDANESSDSFSFVLIVYDCLKRWAAEQSREREAQAEWDRLIFALVVVQDEAACCSCEWASRVVRKMTAQSWLYFFLNGKCS